jgi:hypothetical protein
MKKSTLLLMAVCALAGVASASTVWNPAGNTVTPGSQAWGDSDNWTNGLPDSVEKAVFNVPGVAECQINGLFSGLQVVQGENNLGGVLPVLNGGSLITILEWSAVDYNNTAHMIWRPVAP